MPKYMANGVQTPEYTHTHTEANVTSLVADLATLTAADLARQVVYKYTYDFAVLGGATGTIVLTATSGAIPDKFVIQNVLVDVRTVLDSATHVATVALATPQAANDLVVAAIVAGAPWSSTGRKVTIPLLGTIATWIKATAARSPAIVVAVEALTQGVFDVYVQGVQGA